MRVPKSKFPIKAIGVDPVLTLGNIPDLSTFPSSFQIRGTGPGGQLQDLDCSSSEDEVAVQNTAKPR